MGLFEAVDVAISQIFLGPNEELYKQKVTSKVSLKLRRKEQEIIKRFTLSKKVKDKIRGRASGLGKDLRDKRY